MDEITTRASYLVPAPESSGSHGPLLSVVMPCYNEEEALPKSFERLSRSLDRIEGIRWEVILVNDGSRDGTGRVIDSLQRNHPSIRALHFARNFGHQAAVTAGIDHANGDAIVLIDADLQDPPELIADMVREWRRGAHVVYGVRRERHGETLFKLVTAKLFYRMLDTLSDVRIPRDTGDFRLMDRRVADVLRVMPERDRFLRGMVAWTGFDQRPLEYVREPRIAGETKYPLSKMVRFALDGVVSFSTSPLRLATWLGFSAAGLALAGIFAILAIRLFTRDWVPGWAATMIAIAFFAGAQLLTIGIIGEYVARLYVQTKGRPLYIVARREGFVNDVGPASARTARGTPAGGMLVQPASGHGSS